MKILEKILDGLTNTFLPNSNERLKVVLLCILTATTFWFFNALNDSYTTRIRYPINITYPDSVYISLDELPDEININVTGGGWNLLRKTFGFTTEPVEIPLSDPSTREYILGSSLYPLISDQMSEIQLNYIETDSIKIEIDSIKTKTAKLKVDSADIDLQENFQITSNIALSHDSAKFNGPKRFIKNIPDVIILNISKTDINKDYKNEVELSTFGSTLVNRNPVEVEVRFKVEKFIDKEEMIPFKKVNAPKDSSNYIFVDSLARVQFKIAESKADDYDTDSIELEVNYYRMNKKDSMVLPQIKGLPELLKNKNIQVDSVEYYYEIQ